MSSGIRVYELAKELEMKNSELVRYLNDLGVSVKSHASTLAADVSSTVRELVSKERKEAGGKQDLEQPVAAAVAEPTARVPRAIAVRRAKEAAAEANLRPRPPVVVIMGHVDHGKTTLLDTVRKTNVTAQEFGGITQHIGAYQVDVHGKKITFLDTPGHEAFTAMRARGAQVTDIVVLVVAAEDGIMPQTVEAINHAKAAAVPIIVAINKVDRPDANPESVKRQLMDHGLVAEDWGGDTVICEISAKQGTGVEHLLEMITLVAEMQELKADPTANAQGTVVEAELDRGRGPVATVVVQQGTFSVGQSIVAGEAYGKIKAMADERGRRMDEAGPAAPIEVVGFNSVPQAGDKIYAVADEKAARQTSTDRIEARREETLGVENRVSLEDLYKQIQEGEIKDLNIVVKGDVQGSVEALSESLSRLVNEEIRVNIVHAGVGPIGDSDILLASASNAIVIGFNIRVDPQAKRTAEVEKVDVRVYNVIYEVLDDVQAAMTGMLKPVFEEVTLGKAEVRAGFRLPKGDQIAGCIVNEGKFLRSAEARVYRGTEEIACGKITSLKHVKEDVREVLEGFECGMIIEGYSDVQVGDTIVAYQIQEKSRI